MNQVKQFVSRYQLAVFFVLACLISWSTVIPLNGSVLPQGPMFAAFIVLGIVVGRHATSELWRQMTNWRVNWKWYLIAPGIVVLFQVGGFAVNLLMGARIVSTSHLEPSPFLLGILLPLLLVGGLWEEPGWTGWLLPRFQSRFAQSPLRANLAVGVYRMLWHTPLLISGAISWYDYVFYAFALQLIIGWLYNRTGSVIIPMLVHLCSNVSFSIMMPFFSGAAHEQHYILVIAFSCIVALGLTVPMEVRSRRERLVTKPSI